jgi:hypothetical protein
LVLLIKISKGYVKDLGVLTFVYIKFEKKMIRCWSWVVKPRFFKRRKMDFHFNLLQRNIVAMHIKYWLWLWWYFQLFCLCLCFCSFVCFLCLYVCLFVCLFCMFVCLFIYLFVFLFCLFIQFTKIHNAICQWKLPNEMSIYQQIYPKFQEKPLMLTFFPKIILIW